MTGACPLFFLPTRTEKAKSEEANVPALGTALTIPVRTRQRDDAAKQTIAKSAAEKLWRTNHLGVLFDVRPV